MQTEGCKLESCKLESRSVRTAQVSRWAPQPPQGVKLHAASHPTADRAGVLGVGKVGGIVAANHRHFLPPALLRQLQGDRGAGAGGEEQGAGAWPVRTSQQDGMAGAGY
jgi:hypothetical protein